MKGTTESNKSNFPMTQGRLHEVGLTNDRTLSSYSIVVPAGNEEETIGDVLEVVRHMTDDLIVVDRHSTNQTVVIAGRHGARVVEDNSRGKGDAVRVGLAHARYPITVFIDADGSHEPKDIPALVAPIVAGEADLVMASRDAGRQRRTMRLLFEVIRLMGSLAISLPN